MSTPARRRLNLSFDFIPRTVSVIAVAVGVLVLIGWVFDVETLKSVIPGLTIMKVNTAAGFILAGVALWGIASGAQRRPMHIVTAVCAGIVLLLGLLTLVEYVSGADFGIDQFLIRELTHLSGDIPGRMAVNTALSFSAVGAALLLLSLEHGGMVVAIHALAIVPIVLGGSALIGYGYDIEEFLREKANYTPMSIHAATVFVLFAFGLVSARADYPFRRFVTSGNPAGVMVRRLLPAATGFMLVAGWLILQGYHAGYFSETFALALFTAVSIAGLGVMILWNAGTLYDAAVQRERMEEALRENEERLNTIINILPVGLWVLSGEGSVVYSNPAAQRIWAGVRYVDIERLGEYKGWWLDSGKLVEPHEWAGARAVQKGETSTEEEIEIECFDGTHKIILDSAVPLRRSDGSIRGAVTVNQDITERKRNDAVNASRLHLVQFAQTHSLDELLEETLNETERLTGSLIGFYHLVDEDQNSLTLQAWSTRTKAEFCKAEGKGLHYPITEAGVWADCVRQGKPVIHNDYAALLNRKGMPEGHATVIRELVVPVRRGNKLSVILGVGNKPDNYTERDVEAVLLIADLTGEIAARKRAEEALANSSALLNTTQRLSKVGGWEFDVGTGRSIWTEELYRLHEMPADSNIDHVEESLKCYSPEDRTIISDAFKRAAENGEAYDLELPFTTFKGQALWIRTTGQPVYENGKVVRVIGNLMDITERKRAEEQLRAASSYTRSLIEASLDPLVTINVAGKITDVNEATVKATGVPREALVGSDFSDYFTEPDKARAGYQEVFARGAVTDYPLTLRHVSGEVMEVLYNASVYHNEQGGVTGVFAAARDVTRVRQAERQLRERLKELQAFYHLSELAARKDFPLDDLCQELTAVLPGSWQYPEITCARIVVGERELRTPNFRISEWMQAAPIKVFGAVIGKVEVGYLEEKPEESEGPFVKEERQLIDAIAERVGQITELKRIEADLRASEELFRALADATSEGMLIHEHGRIVEANRQMEGILGRPRAEIVGATILDFVAPAYRDMVSSRVQAPEDERVELAFLRPDGSKVIVSGLAHPCVYLGRPMRVAVYRNITMEKRAEEALRNVGAYNRSLIEVSLDPLVTISPGGKITDVNEATVQATGMPRSLLIGSDFSDYFTEPDKARAGYQEVFAKGFVTDYPLSLRHVSGRAKDVLYNASIYRNAKGEVAGVFAAARDITERRKLERELEQQARKDMLTGLDNRRHFFELAGQELARSRRHDEPLSLLMMDVDHFKAVNDTYGHHIGDAALQKLSEICLRAFREVDFVGRLGGEEFAALLPETNLEQALEVAERLRQAVENAAVKLDDGSLMRFTVSIGVVGLKPTDARIETALRRADAALYKAKNSGRNRVCSDGTGGNNKV